MKSQRIMPVLLSVASILLLSCGKEKSSGTADKKLSATSCQAEQRTAFPDNEKSSRVVDADKFSSAFTDISSHPSGADQNQDKSGTIHAGSGLSKKYFDCGALAENRFFNGDFLQNELPAGCTAARVGGENKYSWLPHWNYTGKGGVMIPDADISSDKSLIAILENVSGTGESLSTLLVLIDTYRFDIRAIYFFESRNLTTIRFVPGTLSAVVWCSRQNEDGDLPPSGHLIKINLADGRVLSESLPLEAESANFAVSKGAEKIVLKAGDGKNSLYLFSSADLRAQPVQTECSQKSGKVAVSGDSGLFAFAGKEKLEIFKFSDNMKLKDIPATAGAIPDDFIFAGKNIFAELSYSQPVLLISRDETAEICPSGGSILFFRGETNTLLFEQYMNRAIALFDLKTLKITDTFIPEKLKPKTVGHAVLLDYLPGIDKYILLDNNGNLSLYYKPGRRWKKSVVFHSDK